MNFSQKFLLVLLFTSMSTLGIAADPVQWQPLMEASCGGAMTALSISPHDHQRVLVAGDMLGIGVSEDGGDTWRSTSGLTCYEIADFTWHPTDPHVVWAGTMGGPVVSSDAGLTWSTARHGFPPLSNVQYSAPIEKILFDPRDVKRLLAFGGSSRGWTSPGKPLWGAVWESTDGGAAWSRLTIIGRDGTNAADETAGVNLIAAVRDAVNPNTIYVVASGEGVLISEDNGHTWSKRTAGLPSGTVCRLVAHPTKSGTLWVALGSSGAGADRRPGSIYMTSDGGRTWTPRSDGLAQTVTADDNFTSRYTALAISPTDPDLLYTNDSAWNTGVIYRSRDGGAHWEGVATKGNVGHGTPKGIAAVATFYPAGIGMGPSIVSPTDPRIVLFANSEFIVRSRDGGTTWEDVTARPVPSTDGWRGTGYSGLCSVNARFNPHAPDWLALNAMDAGKLLQSRDGLHSWTLPAAKPNPWMGGNDTSFADARTAYTTLGQHGTFGGIASTTDGGVTWSVHAGVECGLPNAESRGDATGIFASHVRPAAVWAVVNGTLRRSQDGGLHWTEVDTGHGLTWLAGDPTSADRFYASGIFNIYRCDDGATLVPIGGPRGGGRLAVDAKGLLYAVGAEGRNGGSSGLWRYDGHSWTRLLDDRFLVNVAIDPRDSTRLAACTNEDPFNDECDAKGVYLSSDAGRTWRLANQGLAMLRGYALAFDPADHERLVFGSFGRGYFITRWLADERRTGDIICTALEDGSDLVSVDAARREESMPFLANGSMENGTDLPTGWNSLWTGEGKLRAFRDHTTAQDGRASLCISSVGGPAKGLVGQTVEGYFPNISVKGSLRSSGKARLMVAIQPFNEDWKALAFKVVANVEGNSEWNAFTGRVTLPPDTVRWNVVLFLEGDGSGWLDGVSVKTAP